MRAPATAARVVRLILLGSIAALVLSALPGSVAWANGSRSADPPREAPVMRVGGCQTSEREYGLAFASDSAAVAAVGELIAPGEGPKGGPACARLGVDTPLFVQIGSVAPLADAEWIAAAQALGARMDSCGLVLAERSLLRHTTGPCFPPYHIDLRACGREAQVARFLVHLTDRPWGRFEPTAERGQRRLMICAGRNMSLMNTVVDLK